MRRETGNLTVIKGPMFSGKSNELIEQMVRFKYARETTQLFKPVIDDRGEGLKIVRTHSRNEMEALAVEAPQGILDNLKKDVGVIGVDEVEFFDRDIVPMVLGLMYDRGLRVVVAGLPTDFRGEPFGSMPELLARADKVIERTAVCTFDCGDGLACEEPATMTQRLINRQPAKWSDPVVKVGAEDYYEARCRRHHIVLEKPF